MRPVAGSTVTEMSLRNAFFFGSKRVEVWRVTRVIIASYEIVKYLDNTDPVTEDSSPANRCEKAVANARVG